MANTSSRMLRLLSLLQNHRYWVGRDLAGRLEVSERTLRRDIDRLRELGYAVDASRGVAGGYQLRSGTGMPPLLLDDDEAVAIAVGLREAAGGTVSGIEETSVRALTKVIQVMPPRLRHRLDALRAYTVPGSAASRQSVDATTLTLIAQACRDSERLRFDYTGPANRHVEPYRLVFLRRRWYLVAWDLDRADWRTFRVDRLVGARSTGGRFQQREIPTGDAAAFVQDRLSAIPTRYEVVVIVHAPAAVVEQAAAYTGGVVVAVDETSCRLTMKVDAFDWPVLLLAALEARFDVVEPPAFRDYLRVTGQRFASAAG